MLAPVCPNSILRSSPSRFTTGVSLSSAWRCSVNRIPSDRCAELASGPVAYKPRVFLSAVSTLSICSEPIFRAIADSSTVARLSAITTESDNNPELAPSVESKLTRTLLGWPARKSREVIMARTTCGSPVARPSACTTKAGLWRALRRDELGNCANTTSPWLNRAPEVVIVVVDVHFGAFPFFGKGA